MISEKVINGFELGGEHLDSMIRLAFLYGDAMEAKRLADEAGDTGPEDGDDVIIRARKKLINLNACEKRKRRLNILGNMLRKTVNAAACFVVMAAVTVPVALATIPELKTYVSELFIEHYPTYADIRMYDEPLPPLEVPAGWDGRYYLSYIPEGFELADIDTLYNLATYKSDLDHIFYFIEMKDGDGFILDNEDADISYAEINCNEVMFIEKRNSDLIYAVWTNGEELFKIIGNLQLSEMVELVYGVRTIHIQKLDILPLKEPEDVQKNCHKTSPSIVIYCKEGKRRL